MTVKKITQYNPQRDVQEEHELNKRFLEIIPSSTIQYFNQLLIEHLYKKLKVTEGFILDQLFTEYPMLLRVLAYIYSPPEDYDTRIKMLELWHKADLARKDYRNPQVQHDVFFCRSLQGLPEVANCPTLKAFLNGLYKDFSLVINNDIDRGLSEKGFIREPRNNVYEDEDQKIITINQSPFFKIKHCINKKTNQIEIHYHLLKDDEDLNEFFTDTDAYLTEWLQWFPKERQSGKPAKLFIHCPDGELIQPPGNHVFRDQLKRNQNYIPFDLLTKYTPLIRKTGSERSKSTKNLCGDLILKKDLDASSPNKEDLYKELRETCQGEAFFAFSERVVPEWKGNIPPAAHFKKYLPLRTKDQLKKKENIENRQPETLKQQHKADQPQDKLQPGDPLENLEDAGQETLTGPTQTISPNKSKDLDSPKSEDLDSPEQEDPINNIQDPNPLNLPEEQIEWQETYKKLNQAVSDLKEKSKPLEGIVLEYHPQIIDKKITKQDIQKEYFNRAGEQVTIEAIKKCITRTNRKIAKRYSMLIKK